MLLKPILSLLFPFACSVSYAFFHNQKVILQNLSNSEEPYSFHMALNSATQHDAALNGQRRQAILYNRYAPLKDFHRAVDSLEHLEELHFPSAADDIQADNLACFTHKPECKSKNTPLPPPQKASNGLLTHANLDIASLLALHIFQVLPGDSVLDLCAGAGNNSLVLAQSLWPYLQPDSAGPPLPGAKKGVLHSNEYNLTYHTRLADTLAEYLPSILSTSGQLKVLHVDGTKGIKDLPVVPGGYDKVLVDLSHDQEQNFSQAQSTAPDRAHPSSHNAEDGVQLLLTAIRAAQYGGRVMYTSSSLSWQANEAIVKEALQQAEKEGKSSSTVWSIEVEPLEDDVQKGLEADWADKTRSGWMVLPDHAGSGKSGPLYFSVLTKKAV